MKQIAKYLVFQILCPLLLFFGLDKLVRRLSSNRRIIIMYHGVSGKKNFSINGRHLPSDEFEQHLIYFKKNFNILSLKEICHRNDLAGYSIALTFDDGYLNNIQHAIPLLSKYQIPATFFVSSASLVDPLYLHPSDYIDIIRTSTTEDLVINGTVFKNENRQLRHAEYGNAFDYLNSLNFSDFKKTIAWIRNQYPLEKVLTKIDPEVYTVVSATTVTGLVVEKLFTVGSHGHDHVNLEKLNKGEMVDQLKTSKELLEKHLQAPIDFFAFPYGYFNRAAVEASMEQGYAYLFAGGSISDEWKQRVFPRIGIFNMAGYAFNMLSISHGFQRFGF
jgi:peptidoglycan/xylan/chitin deacetylase (PgdA/CDA1 family)